MIIDCIADLHGHYPHLEGGDLLIVAGDLTAMDTPLQHIDFYEWCKDQLYRKIIIIGGNHDNFIQKLKSKYFPPTVYYSHCECLCDSGTEFEGLKIWGSPWTKTFEGMNPHCMAFTCDTEEQLASKFSLIPEDTDILITHGPAYTIKDGKNPDHNLGSHSLIKKMSDIKCLKLNVFGHIHEGYGVMDLRWLKLKNGFQGGIYANASHVNEHYQPVNKPIRVIL